MLWWVQWLRDAIGALLFTLGLQNKKATIVLVGLDNAGKTTLLHRLASGGLSSFPPTEKPHADRFALGGVSFRAWDLGGHDSVRHLWDDFLPDAHGVVFLVDAADGDRFDEAADELAALAADEAREKESARVPKKRARARASYARFGRSARAATRAAPAAPCV